MTKSYTRREFLKLGAVAGAGLLFQRRALAELVKGSSGNVVFVLPGTERYERLRQGFIKRIQKRPAVIALCKNTQGVVEAIVYAKRKGLPVAIKSGGNSLEGFSCNEGGLVVNLSPITGIEWVDDHTVKVGPACNHFQLYNALVPKGRLLPAGGGPAGDVAIGGLALGGGDGPYSRKYGLACDHLKEVTMVDGTGRIVPSREDPELLWACRGGGVGNFGVITEMIFETRPAPRSFRTHYLNGHTIDSKRAAVVIKRWFQLTAGMPEAWYSRFKIGARKLEIRVSNFDENGTEHQRILDSLKPLLGNVETGRLDLANGNRHYSSASPLFVKNVSAGFYKGFGDIAGGIEGVLDTIAQNRGIILYFTTLGGNIADAAFASASSFPHRSSSCLGRLVAHSESPKTAATLFRKLHDIQQRFKDAGVIAHYVNYPDLDLKDWARAYYGDSYPRLQAVKRRYDPDNLIRYEQSVTA